MVKVPYRIHEHSTLEADASIVKLVMRPPGGDEEEELTLVTREAEGLYLGSLVQVTIETAHFGSEP